MMWIWGCVFCRCWLLLGSLVCSELGPVSAVSTSPFEPDRNRTIGHPALLHTRPVPRRPPTGEIGGVPAATQQADQSTAGHRAPFHMAASTLRAINAARVQLGVLSTVRTAASTVTSSTPFRRSSVRNAVDPRARSRCLTVTNVSAYACHRSGRPRPTVQHPVGHLVRYALAAGAPSPRARGRAAPVSRRRQIDFATASGSPGASSG